MIKYQNLLLNFLTFQNFKFPNHVGWPIGAADSMKYVVLETHFDNPTQRPGKMQHHNLILIFPFLFCSAFSVLFEN